MAKKVNDGFVVTVDGKVINRQLKALESMRGAFEKAAHIQALCGLLYAVDCRQTTPMNQLVQVMGHAMGAMNKWAVEYGPFRWVGKTKNAKGEVVPAHLALDDAKHASMQAEYVADKAAFIGALSTLKTYSELTKPQNDFPGVDLLKVVKREIAKTERYLANPEKYDLSKVNADGLPGLKAWATELELKRQVNLPN